MKKYIFSSALALAAIVTACEDEVLVPVEDNTRADEMLADIATLDNLTVTYDAEAKTIRMENEALANTIDSLYQVRNQVNAYYKESEVQYTVNVLSGAEVMHARMGVEGAEVTVVQNDYRETQATVNGAAVFTGLKEGDARVFISAADYSDVEMVVRFYNSNYYSEGAVSYNASSQVMLFPTGGESMATIKGKVYANTSTLNDTLGRTFGYDATYYGGVEGQYVSQPGVYSGTNYTDWWNDYNGTPYNSGYTTGGTSIAFEEAPSSFKMYAIAQPVYYSDNYEAGYITSLVYSELVFDVTVSGNEYSVMVPASLDYMNIEFQVSEVIADFTRYTYNYGDMGANVEAGSEPVTFKFYNSTDFTVYKDDLDGNGNIVYDNPIAPNTTVELNLRKITQSYYFELENSDIYNGSDFNLKPGQTLIKSLFLFPMYPESESPNI